MFCVKLQCTLPSLVNYFAFISMWLSWLPLKRYRFNRTCQPTILMFFSFFLNIWKCILYVSTAFVQLILSQMKVVLVQNIFFFHLMKLFLECACHGYFQFSKCFVCAGGNRLFYDNFQVQIKLWINLPPPWSSFAA